MTDPTPLQIVIVDDHPVFRDGLAMLLSSMDGIEVVATAGDGREGIETIAEAQPDVVVMDVQMPELDGIAATREITSTQPHIKVLVLTMSNDDETVFAAMRAGAKGYLLKGAAQSEIRQAIDMVASGGLVFGAEIARRVNEFFVSGPSAKVPDVAFPQLTAREREILDLLAAGRSNAQIAQTLFLSPKTVRNNTSNIFTKLQVADRAEAIVRARDSGMGRL
ncbi:DNA-binding NarL/FixJ family response regulator [Microbacteriaceae bacterium SG_E_30_P1]|uniref:DNA-binding NarL/FixJ family response regulator n=1 Tax=Antiquaquibacter oligotrophicus TaxID=2880260 RepID=A0ABT6KQ66_9MICO|nr:response regulator transcription factor [Antiquaquibacter oligotrophicus]MDH6181930.1 DNA-binding NarL/FixJ family response regulator [Antiquaquibacter oligotrophicus]UDF12399.1 response regulator transcription factor [Antiquaquibacter oligotrophicus]